VSDANDTAEAGWKEQSPLVWVLVPIGACMLLGFMLLAAGAIVGGPDEDTDARGLTDVATTTRRPDEVLAAFEDADLSPPNPRDTTEGNCDGVDFLCSKWVTTDILTIVVWDTPEAADRWADGPLSATVIDPHTTVHFQEGGTTPDYDRAAYEAVIARLNGEG